MINSIGNCYNSLGQYAEAREAYLVSSQLFQQAKGFRGRNGSTTPRLDGAIFAASNAALMLAQLGDVDGAISEVCCRYTDILIYRYTVSYGDYVGIVWAWDRVVQVDRMR